MKQGRFENVVLSVFAVYAVVYLAFIAAMVWGIFRLVMWIVTK